MTNEEERKLDREFQEWSNGKFHLGKLQLQIYGNTEYAMARHLYVEFVKHRLSYQTEAIGEMKENGVNWFGKNPHAFPIGTKFYTSPPNINPDGYQLIPLKFSHDNREWKPATIRYGTLSDIRLEMNLYLNDPLLKGDT